MNTSRILVIGLDGATFDLIRPWAAQGKLPMFQRLLAEGVSGDLESTTGGLIERRKCYALRLMQDQPWDFIMVHFLALDLLQHALWRYEEHALSPEEEAEIEERLRGLGYLG